MGGEHLQISESRVDSAEHPTMHGCSEMKTEAGQLEVGFEVAMEPHLTCASLAKERKVDPTKRSLVMHRTVHPVHRPLAGQAAAAVDQQG